MKPLRTFLVVYPLALPLAFFVTWLAGRWELGRWPRPSLDDPKSIGGWVDLPYSVASLLLTPGLPLFVAALLAFVTISWRDSSRRANASMISVAVSVCLLGSIALLRWDPLRFVEWYFD